MNEILDDLRERLHLDYISDLKFYGNKNKIIALFNEFHEADKYTEEQIKRAADYIMGPNRGSSYTSDLGR